MLAAHRYLGTFEFFDGLKVERVILMVVFIELKGLNFVVFEIIGEMYVFSFGFVFIEVMSVDLVL